MSATELSIELEGTVKNKSYTWEWYLFDINTAS